MKPKKEQKERVFDSMEAAAGALNLKIDQIKAAKAAGSDAFSGSRVDGEKLLLFIADNPEIGKATEGINIAIEEALKMRADREIKEHKLAELRRNVIQKDEIKRTVTKMIVGAKSQLLGCEKAMTMKARMELALTDEQVMKLGEIIAAGHVGVMKSMAKGEWFEAKCPQCKGVF
jgi:hypothetical protein